MFMRGDADVPHKGTDNIRVEMHGKRWSGRPPSHGGTRRHAG